METVGRLDGWKATKTYVMYRIIACQGRPTHARRELSCCSSCVCVACVEVWRFRVADWVTGSTAPFFFPN